MTHRIGIVGLGTVGSRFVEQFGRHPDFDLVAAWDADPHACAAHHGDVSIAPDADAVIAASDVVYIAVPPLAHRGYVDACLDAGTAIFCEKPLGVDVAESRRLVDAVEASALPAGVNFVFSSAPAARELVAHVDTGRLGPLVSAELRLHFEQWPRAWHTRAQWLRLRDQGGWIREVASHFLFVAQRALGPLRLESASVAYPDGPDGELSEVDATARYTSETAPLLVLGTSGGAGPDVVEFVVRGEDGAVRLLDWYRLQAVGGDGWTDVLGEDRAELAAAAYAAQLDELAALLRGDPSSIATFAEALAVQELAEATLLGA